MLARDIAQNRLYKDLAWLWPLVSVPEDYAKEAAFWKNVLRSRLGDGRHHLLELGVGGGNNLSHLTADFDATAVDLSPEMLEHCRKLNPSVDVHVGDMRSVRLDREFDAVIIHDAVSYLASVDDIRATMQTAWVHLRSGGVFVFSPDYVVETFSDNCVRHDVTTVGNTTLAYYEFDWQPDPAAHRVECLITYVIRQGEKLTVEHDRHVVGLFSRQVWLDELAAAGFAADTVDYPVHDDARQGYLFVGVKP
ncbi:methyltransferase domain-containing protein [candidate division GN15 bacterium]|nr:methyltransferase domain-containing protein [candidate division GN15 bacterium]